MNKKYIKPSVSTKALNKLTILAGSLEFNKPSGTSDNITLEGKQNSIFEGFRRPSEDNE